MKLVEGVKECRNDVVEMRRYEDLRWREERFH